MTTEKLTNSYGDTERIRRDNMRRHLRKTEVRVQVERRGVTQTARGVLHRSAGRANRSSTLTKVKGHLVDGGRSLVAFVCGLLLVSVYALTALFLQKQPLWFCSYTAIIMAALAAFGLGLSAGVRANIMVMLPSLCSAHGRRFFLFLFASVLLSGPLTNTMENMERAAASLLCGAELAANQTQELMQRSATPLFSLDKIKKIGSNAHAVAGRVQNFIHTLTNGVRHVARTLRNVLHFLVDIGEVCNAKLGSPYRKCRAVFAEARADCSYLLGEFNFLCDIVDSFLPLCSIAHAGELFCTVPVYIADHLRKRLAAPTVAAFERLKEEFDFTISASVSFDLDANSSRSLQQVSQDILEEVSSDLHLFQRLSEPLTYAGLLLLAISFLRAVRYRRRYLTELDFDNVYISAQFEELDHQVTLEGGASVLPITCREAKIYIPPLSFKLTAEERRAGLMGMASVLRHLVMGCLVVALDFLVFWVLDQVHHQVKGDVMARAPVTVAVQVNGSGYASDIFRDLVASFNILQGGNITVISRRCLLEPSEPDYGSCFILGFLLGLCLLLSLSGAFMGRCRRLVCALFHPIREQVSHTSTSIHLFIPVS
ncbi:DC-STAMP domain-containing protein 2 isoform X1 [Xyrichtys novacula]|uniref:DC-STAMP domain-containing protein 2 isoform X1 n=1 Tax=Xyrichtys novacula TaxID=13765 RepID=A0AAV1FKX5_XYRNO|nr:DC-STAMP domain-containing protein 2 isoform X1 [Xyrichtys novacula]